MNREREIFLEALEQPTQEARAAFIEQATAGDAKLRDAVSSHARRQDTCLSQQRQHAPVLERFHATGTDRDEANC